METNHGKFNRACSLFITAAFALSCIALPASAASSAALSEENSVSPLNAAISSASNRISEFTDYVSASVSDVFGTTDLASLPTGVTVRPATWKDNAGEYGDAYKAAGYKATFVYKTDRTDVASVQVTGTMGFYSDADVQAYAQAGYPNGTSDIVPKSAYEYEEGMCTATNNAPGVTAQDGHQYDLVAVADGVYAVSMPLPAQMYICKYIITYQDGSSEKTDDCIFYVGTETSAPDYAKNLYPVDEKYRGTIEYASVTATSGIEQNLEIYLPYNYDPTKTYKTLYASHGSNGDETDWFTVGSLDEIMDHLVMSGTVEDTIIVTMDNNHPFNNLADLPAVARNLAEVIVPYIEANYPVSTAVEDRAVFGLSAGGSMATALMQSIPEQFSYIGISSVGRSFPISNATANPDDIRDTRVAVYCGCMDWRMNASYKIYEETASLGGDVTFKAVDGAHDWLTWSEAVEDFMTNVMWK